MINAIQSNGIGQNQYFKAILWEIAAISNAQNGTKLILPVNRFNLIYFGSFL